ncbi:MAG TPA: signal recognition particle protein [Phycisphaerae bacterium]|mgnify:CR=1 FL=1|nr:signal recognition particle protein [Phycisphaerae bacterium]HPS53481.1 signal recognition particle protein [Phycisphaerae bacterium]
MFEALTDKFSDVFRKMSGRGRLTEENIHEAMREVRTALLEADVHYQVAKKFCDDVAQKAVGTEVLKSLHPSQLMIKIVNDELTALMGPVDTRIYFVSPGPTIIMMAGLQGAGKTTTCGKLANYLIKQGKKPLMVACDLQRPAAVDQLTIVGEQVGVPTFRMEGEKNPVAVARKSINYARGNGNDVVIIDTAGRLHIDEEMMQQAQDIASAVNPHQIYLVCDAMTGQDAVNSAQEFNNRLELDGVILTKFDSDARGGAALSVKAVTGKPLKFIGVGEKFDALEEFYPDRMASRILGMGDVVSLVEKAQEAFDQEQAQKMQEKMAKGRFTLVDFMQQMKAMQKMGPLKQILKLMPGMGANAAALDMIKGDEFKQLEAIINSMTPKERDEPDTIEASRRRRIARGAGCQPQDVSGLVKSFGQAANMMKTMANMGIGARMRMASQMAQGGMTGMGKIKQRSKRLSPKERAKRRDKKKKRR